MTTDPNGGPRLPRRGLLALAALAVLPAAACSTAPPSGAGTPAVPVAGAGAASAAARTSTSPSPSRSASAKPSASPSPTVVAEQNADAVQNADAGAGRSKRGGPVPLRPGAALLGSYLGLKGLSLAQSLALRRRQLGRDQRIVHAFNSWDEALYLPTIAASSTLMLSWNGARYSEITNGSADRRIAAAARRLAEHGRPALLRWGWEMNGNWFGWDGSHNGRDPDGYVTAWRRLHRIFREQGADNVAWVWSPNWNSGPDVSWNRFQHYYPGDAYVDWVGVSGYNFDSESPKTLFTPICEAYGDRKPIILTETAAIEHGGRSKADWIAKLAAFVKATPAIGGVVWFDTDTHTDEHNFRFDSTAAALTAYRAMARSARFAG